MDTKKTGELIRALRTELGLTQQQLACRLHVGDKAVFKWERGGGCPDVSLLPALAEVLGVGLESLMAGELDAKEQTGGNMKRTKFFVCPDCGGSPPTGPGAGGERAVRHQRPPYGKGTLSYVSCPAAGGYPAAAAAVSRVGTAGAAARRPWQAAVVLYPPRPVLSGHMSRCQGGSHLLW